MAKKRSSSKKGTNSNKRGNRMSKRENWEELEAARKRNKTIAWTAVILAFITIVVLIAAYTPESPANTTTYDAPYQVVGGEILIPKSDVTTTTKFYSYNSNGVYVKFFALIGSDGQVHTAFDACDVCYREKKGYYQDGNNMVCRNCGQRFSTNQIGTANQGGGCWPGYLESSIKGENVVIKISELDRGRYYFG